MSGDHHRESLSVTGRGVPFVAAALAVGYLLGVAFPPLLPLLVVAASVGGCALVFARRSSVPLRWSMIGIGLWLSAGLAGAWWLRAAPVAGLAWVVLALFLLPLPVVPWLYARTFTERESGQPVPPRSASPAGRETRDAVPAEDGE